mgnify:CR=1 FL=1
MNEQDVNQLSGEALKDQAKILGVSLKGNPGEAKLRERILEVLNGGANSSEGSDANKHQNIDLNNDQEPGKSTKSKTVTINIATSEKDKQPVAVGLNGKVYRMKRGVNVEVPEGVVSILNDAIQMHRDPETGEDRPVPAYPFQIVSN